jgi:hypothetical protein
VGRRRGAAGDARGDRHHHHHQAQVPHGQL